MRISRDQFVRLQKRYHTDQAIARLFGITRQAVHQLRNRYALDPVMDRHRRRNDDIARLYREGLSGERIARRYRISVSQVFRILRAASVELRNPRPR